MGPSQCYCLHLKELPGAQGRGPLRYLDVLTLLLQAPLPGRGLTTDEVRHRAQMQRALLMDTQVATFSEKQYAFLVEMAQKHTWSLATLELDAFLNDLFSCSLTTPDAQPVKRAEVERTECEKGSG